MHLIFKDLCLDIRQVGLGEDEADVALDVGQKSTIKPLNISHTLYVPHCYQENVV